MDLEKLINENDIILMEGSVVERLRRDSEIYIDPILMNAPLIYDDYGREALSSIYHSYIDIAEEADIPFMMITPTWRTNRERIEKSGINKSINKDAVKYMEELKKSRGEYADQISIGGMIGCKFDCYKPEEGLSVEEAEEFHSWQIKQLVDGGVDFLIVETIPRVNEALGIAKAMSRFNVPYFISFVISRDGNVLDGTPINDAVKIIDSETSIKPIGYTVNCAYPTFLCAPLQPEELFDRFIGYQGNASSLDHCELDNSKILHVDSISDWGDEMVKLNRHFGVKIMGGCCGTGVEHLRYIVDKIKNNPKTVFEKN